MKQKRHLAVNAQWQPYRGTKTFWKYLKMNLKMVFVWAEGEGRYFWDCSAMHQSPGMHSIGAQATPLQTATGKTGKRFFPHFLIRKNILTCHFYIRERHHQTEDNLKTIPLFGNTFFMFGKISTGNSRDGWEGLGDPQRLLKRSLVSKSPSGGQTSAEKHQEAPSQCKVSSSEAKVRHSSKTAPWVWGGHLCHQNNLPKSLSQARYPNSLDPQCRGHLPFLLGCGGNLCDELGLDPLNFTQLQLGEGDARAVPGLRIKLTTLCFPALQLNC